MSFVPDGWQASSSELTDKTVLITGASRGIGEAVALSCCLIHYLMFLIRILLH